MGVTVGVHVAVDEAVGCGCTRQSRRGSGCRSGRRRYCACHVDVGVGVLVGEYVSVEDVGIDVGVEEPVHIGLGVILRQRGSACRGRCGG